MLHVNLVRSINVPRPNRSDVGLERYRTRTKTCTNTDVIYMPMFKVETKLQKLIKYCRRHEESVTLTKPYHRQPAFWYATCPGLCHLTAAGKWNGNWLQKTVMHKRSLWEMMAMDFWVLNWTQLITNTECYSKNQIMTVLVLNQSAVN